MAVFDYKNIHVLLIDDEQFMLKLVDRVLKELGASIVSTASDGLDALGKLEDLQRTRHPVDIVVCDVDMPNMNGLEFVKRVRGGTSEAQADIPIVMLTGHGDEETVLQAIGLKINGYVVKPVSPNTLDKRLRSALAATTKL